MIQEHVWMKVDEPCIFCMEIDLKYFLCYRDSGRETPKFVISFITWALVLQFLSRGRLGMGMGVLGMGRVFNIQKDIKYRKLPNTYF